MANHRRTIDTMRYMRNRPGQIIHYSDVAADVNLTNTQVNSALGYAVAKHPEWGIERRGSGQYVFLPEKQKDSPPDKPAAEDPTQSVYEGVGVTKDGSRIIRDTNGVLWKLSDRL